MSKSAVRFVLFSLLVLVTVADPAQGQRFRGRMPFRPPPRPIDIPSQPPRRPVTPVVPPSIDPAPSTVPVHGRANLRQIQSLARKNDWRALVNLTEETLSSRSFPPDLQEPLQEVRTRASHLHNLRELRDAISEPWPQPPAVDTLKQGLRDLKNATQDPKLAEDVQQFLAAKALDEGHAEAARLLLPESPAAGAKAQPRESSLEGLPNLGEPGKRKEDAGERKQKAKRLTAAIDEQIKSETDALHVYLPKLRLTPEGEGTAWETDREGKEADTEDRGYLWLSGVIIVVAGIGVVAVVVALGSRRADDARTFPTASAGRGVGLPAAGVIVSRKVPAGTGVVVMRRVEPNTQFRREGNDIILDVPLTHTEAALGGWVDVPTLCGGWLIVTLKPGTVAGSRLRLRGYGINGGHQYLQFKIVSLQDEAAPAHPPG